MALVFGVATTVEAIHRSLPHSLTSHLSIRKFSSTPSVQLLAQLIEELTTSKVIQFKLGGNTIKHLLETFMFQDFSVKHFLMAYKVRSDYVSTLVYSSLCRKGHPFTHDVAF